MVKLRITGERHELEQLIAWLESHPEIKVLEKSGAYPNQGSAYHRQYIEVRIDSAARWREVQHAQFGVN